MPIDPDDYENISKRKSEKTKTTTTKSLLKPEIRIVKEVVEKVIKKKSWFGFFFSLLFLCAAGVFFYLWWDVKNSMEELKTQYNDISGELEKYKRLYHQEEDSKNEFREKYEEIKERVVKLTFKVGELNKPASGSYDNGYKMFFQVYKPIILRSVYVNPQKKGRIKLVLYDRSGSKIRETAWTELENPRTWQKVNLDFDIDEGRYYLTFEGTTKLLYHSTGLKYPYKKEGIIEITGIASRTAKEENQGYYQYFYEWRILIN